VPNRVHAIFDSVPKALAAQAELLREGFERKAITLLSNEPIHQSEEAGGSRSHIGSFAILGGILGATSAVLLTVITTKRVGVVTGGMPIVSPWTFGIIAFELTMLGAILFSLACMLYESGLGRRGALKNYDSSVSEGKIVIFADCSSDLLVEKAERVLGKG